MDAPLDARPIMQWDNNNSFTCLFYGDFNASHSLLSFNERLGNALVCQSHSTKFHMSRQNWIRGASKAFQNLLVQKLYHLIHFCKSLFFQSHREFLLRNGIGKTCLWKKYILLYECRQNQGKNNF